MSTLQRTRVLAALTAVSAPVGHYVRSRPRPQHRVMASVRRGSSAITTSLREGDRFRTSQVRFVTTVVPSKHAMSSWGLVAARGCASRTMLPPCGTEASIPSVCTSIPDTPALMRTYRRGG